MDIAIDVETRRQKVQSVTTGGSEGAEMLGRMQSFLGRHFRSFRGMFLAAKLVSIVLTQLQ